MGEVERAVNDEDRSLSVVLKDQRFADRHACTAGGLNDSAELLGSGRVGGGLLGGDASALAAAGVRRAAGRGEGGGEGDGYGKGVVRRMVPRAGSEFAPAWGQQFKCRLARRG